MTVVLVGPLDASEGTLKNRVLPEAHPSGPGFVGNRLTSGINDRDAERLGVVPAPVEHEIKASAEADRNRPAPPFDGADPATEAVLGGRDLVIEHLP